MMSVCLCGPSEKRIATPLGPPFGSLSAAVGTPAEPEKRTMTGVELALACGARVSVAAPGAGVNRPVHMMPLA